MSNGTRALIQRPRRKMHLAVLDGQVGAWATFCDLYVADDADTWAREWESVKGVTWRLVGELRAIIRTRRAGSLCAHCNRYVLLMELLQQDKMYRPGARYLAEQELAA